MAYPGPMTALPVSRMGMGAAKGTPILFSVPQAFLHVCACVCADLPQAVSDWPVVVYQNGIWTDTVLPLLKRTRLVSINPHWFLAALDQCADCPESL